jgi:hypothetical protein
MNKISARAITIDTRDLSKTIAELSQTANKLPAQTQQVGAAKTPQELAAAQQQAKNTMDLVNRAITQLKLKVDEMKKPVMAADDAQAPEFWRKNLDYGERTACSSCAIKTADVRGEGVKDCPFSLTIPRACKTAGNAVDKMTPTENLPDETKERFVKHNKLLFAYEREDKPCKYADKVLDDKFNKVDCDFGDNAAGTTSGTLEGSPLYPQLMHGISLDGLYGHPLGWYGDNTSARNLFFGLFSYLGSDESTNNLIKSGDIGLAFKSLLKHR